MCAYQVLEANHIKVIHKYWNIFSVFWVVYTHPHVCVALYHMDELFQGKNYHTHSSNMRRVSRNQILRGPDRLKIITLSGGQINDPSLGKHFSLLFLPATPSSPSRTLEGLFELTRLPSRALNSPRALLPELQRYKDTVRCGALGAEVPGHCQEQVTQTLIVR